MSQRLSTFAAGLAALAAPAACLALLGGATSAAAVPTCLGERATIVDTGFIEGTDGRDVIVASGTSEVHSHGGDDLICGTSLAYGGPGDDRIVYRGSTDYDIELRGGGGDDRIALLSRGLADLVGGRGDDVIRADRGQQVISGGSGADRLSGGRGNDLIYGGEGRDVVRGGLGTDRCHGERTSGCED